jgi:ABC-2 type transport system permease protein
VSLAPAAAPAHRRVAAQAGMELRLLARNGENLLVALGIPVGLLVFFALVDVLPSDGQPAVDFLLPGVLVAAVMGSALVALAIVTGFERSYLVLKRLGATPLRRPELIAAKVLALGVVEAVQVLVLLATAAGLGWPQAAAPGVWGLVLAAIALALGTAAFAGLGLALAGRLRATATLALANALFVVLLLTSGLLFPRTLLPAAAAAVAGVAPSALLADVLRAVLAGAAPPLGAATGLGLWALGAPLLAARLFRWW